MLLDIISLFNIPDTATPFGKVLLIINAIIFLLVPLLYLTQNLFSFIGLFFKPKRFKETDKLNKYGFIICAHDEEEVLNNLIDSIKIQDYPKDLIEIFVICDNCVDGTKQIALDNGCHVIERNNLEKIGKCYALDYGIKEIINKYSELNIDSFFVFDADNLLDVNYTKKMNDAYNSNVEVCTSFRNSKNFARNSVSACSGMMFLRECQIIHKGRSLVGAGTYISGTGFMVSNKILTDLNGWPFETLIEDIEFSIYCANNGIKIGYCPDAVFYDEQPVRLKDYFIQRLRWCRGNHQCWIKYTGSLIKNMFKKKSFTCSGMLIHITPFPAFLFLWILLYVGLLGVNALVYDLTFMEFLKSGLIHALSHFLFGIAMSLFHGFVLIVRSRKQIKCNGLKLFIYWLLFPIYMVILLLASVLSLFIRVSWKRTPHDCNISIEEV